MACQKVTRMMHESKGQLIGKAPPLHLFHTTVSAWKSSKVYHKFTNLYWQFMIHLLPNVTRSSVQVRKRVGIAL